MEDTMIKCQLKTILKTLNLTQKDLCELINARPSTICSLCNNTFDYLNIHLLNDICDALDCDISDLLIKASWN